MDQGDVVSHYSDVASRYDELYGFVYDKLSDAALKHLRLQPSDLLVDVGAGTGGITHLLWKKANLQNPVLCVDPSSEMLQVAIKRGGLIVCNTTADDFFTTNDWTKYNKVLLNECAHLFPDTLSTLRKAAEYLPKDGLLILINRANVCTFPLWKELKKKFTVHSGDIFQTFLEQAGFKVGVTTETYTIPMTKGEWYTKLRKRMFTALYEFSDEEIEEGLMELDREWFPGKDEGDLIEIKDTLYFFSATK